MINRKKIDDFFEKYPPVGMWGLIANGGFLLLGISICQINATDYNGLPYSWLNHTISELGFVASISLV